MVVVVLMMMVVLMTFEALQSVSVITDTLRKNQGKDKNDEEERRKVAAVLQVFALLSRPHFHTSRLRSMPK